MNNDLPDELPQREVFVLRLWHSKSQPAHWQAQVQHIGSGKTTHVHSFPELQAYILQHIETPPLDKSRKSGLK
ncbi:MAG: hypothetical protein JW862_06270 [Anaerolineales bacterium]|nr:hypothetical protein [Anaerolineales bacterium]